MPEWITILFDVAIAIFLVAFCVFAIGMLAMIAIVCIRYWREKAKSHK